MGSGRARPRASAICRSRSRCCPARVARQHRPLRPGDPRRGGDRGGAARRRARDDPARCPTAMRTRLDGPARRGSRAARLQRLGLARAICGNPRDRGARRAQFQSRPRGRRRADRHRRGLAPGRLDGGGDGAPAVGASPRSTSSWCSRAAASRLRRQGRGARRVRRPRRGRRPPQLRPVPAAAEAAGQGAGQRGRAAGCREPAATRRSRAPKPTPPMPRPMPRRGAGPPALSSRGPGGRRRHDRRRLCPGRAAARPARAGAGRPRRAGAPGPGLRRLGRHHPYLRRGDRPRRGGGLGKPQAGAEPRRRRRARDPGARRRPGDRGPAPAAARPDAGRDQSRHRPRQARRGAGAEGAARGRAGRPRPRSASTIRRCPSRCPTPAPRKTASATSSTPAAR